ncbi:hypothetical protein GCM10010234_54490 [Streptomyces hawaiiensis]
MLRTSVQPRAAPVCGRYVPKVRMRPADGSGLGVADGRVRWGGGRPVLMSRRTGQVAVMKGFRDRRFRLPAIVHRQGGTDARHGVFGVPGDVVAAVLP